MENKKAYLTIDDAPTKDFHDKLKFLVHHNIPAIIFCIGEKILQYPETVMEAIQKGFVIGNHSMTHPHFSDLSLDNCLDQIRNNDEIIEMIYKTSGIERPAKFFRFPFFDTGGDLNAEDYEAKGKKPFNEREPFKNAEKRNAIQSFLKALGYRLPRFEGVNLNWVREQNLLDDYDVRCTFDQMEYWYGQKNAPHGLDKAENILARIDENAPEEGLALNDLSTTDIILIHDHENTTKLFYQILERYLEKGIKFIAAR